VTLPLIVYRSLRQHALSTLVTAASISLAAGLLMTVWVVKAQTRQAFADTTSGFDAVLGARGSKLQLVLNALFHLESSPGNISAKDVETIRRHPAVKTAIPIAVGDNHRGWRIVGAPPELFQVELGGGRQFQLERGGTWYAADRREAVIGSVVAERLGWDVGQNFQPYHGLSFDATAQHEEQYTVVGRLRPTNTPADRVIWIPLAGVQTMSGHNPEAATDVSAVLLQFRAPTAGMMLDSQINRAGGHLTLAFPVGAIVADLFNRMGWIERVLALVAYLVALVAAASVLASIHASMHARRRDLAILRALGARRRTLFGAVVAEAAAIGALGALGGYLVFVGLFVLIAEVLRTQTGVTLALSDLHPVLGWAPLGLVVLAGLGGLVPAWQAYRTPVAENLVPQS
jgi:putative ABC transport system permease protein